MNVAALLPIATQIGNYIKSGIDQYAILKAAGGEVDPDLIAEFLLIKMQDWDPAVSGKKVLDPDTKRAGARFLAGVAFNFARQK